VWPFTGNSHTPTAPPEEGLAERVERLEDTAKRLERRFIKLQGEVTRAWQDRYENAPDEEPEYDGE